MNNNSSINTVNTNTATYAEPYCGYRLPCGLCRYTGSQCLRPQNPWYTVTPTITCGSDSSTATHNGITVACSNAK